MRGGKVGEGKPREEEGVMGTEEGGAGERGDGIMGTTLEGISGCSSNAGKAGSLETTLRASGIG